MSQNTSSAVMAQRHEPHDSLDDFPTPPWATRALVEHVLRPRFPNLAKETVWEPACNRGYMARPLRESFRRVHTSDIHDYSMEWSGQERVVDFLWPGSEPPHIAAEGVDWIITNPPFRLAEAFALRALELRAGVALIVRTAFLEGVARHRNLFSVKPPSIIAQFTERVPMVRGRVDQAISSATSYCWLVWIAGGLTGPAFVWIPPCRKQLERDGDYEVSD